MNIHFSSFFSVEYDLDIMPFWTEYYLKCGFDSYHVFLHKEFGAIDNSIVNEFKRRGFTVECVGGPFGHGILSRLHQDLYAASLPPRDFLVTADADEFQAEPGAGQLQAGEDLFIGPPAPAMIPYRELLTHVDIVTGFMVDRYATNGLEPCFFNPFRQYQCEEPFTKHLLNNFTPPFFRKSDWPATRRTKVLAARAGYKVAREGCHCMLEVPGGAQIAEDYKVYHFAWRESMKKKLLKKVYFTQENCKEVFGNEITGEILDGRVMPEKVFEKDTIQDTARDARFVPENIFQPQGVL